MNGINFVLISKEHNVSILTQILKIFQEKSYALSFSYNSTGTVQKSAPLFHKVFLPYKISGIPKIYFSPRKIYILLSHRFIRHS
jgi:hypothetical protein